MAMTRIDIIMQAINALVPKAEYVMRGNFAGLEWADSRAAPSESAVQAKYDELVAAEPTNLLREKRNQLLAEMTGGRVLTLPHTSPDRLPSSTARYY